MGDMVKSLFFLFLILQFESQYLKIIRGIGLKFCTQVGSDDPMCSDLSVMYSTCKQQCTPIIDYKGEIAYNRTPVVDITIKLGPSTIPITNTFTTKLHICKQQQTSTAN